MKIVVTGATGHIGSSLVPMLVERGHKVVAISRGERLPFYPGMTEYQRISSPKGVDILPPAKGEIQNISYRRLWDEVDFRSADRRALEAEDKFGRYIADLEPDAVCDLICYTQAQAEQLAGALAGSGSHLVFIGTVWVLGYNITVPADESHPRTGFGEYGEGKIAAERLLLDLSARGTLPVTVLHPGHVVGDGWIPLNPQGNFNLNVYSSIAEGKELPLPGFGTATVHHVHARDAAGLIIAALEQPAKSQSQVYMAASRQSVTLRGFAEECFRYFRREPKLRYLPYEEFIASLNEFDAAQSAEHISRSPCVSMEKAERELGFIPQYSSFEGVFESLDSLKRMGLLDS